MANDSSRSQKFGVHLGSQRRAKDALIARAGTLQGMVKFDSTSYELFHMDSYEYEKYVAVMFAAKLFQEIIGAGSEQMEGDDARHLETSKSVPRVSEFMSKAGTLLLAVLEHKKRSRLPYQTSKKTSTAQQQISLERGLPVMKSLQMHALTVCGEFVACSNWHPSIDSEVPKKNATKNIVTVWSLKEPSIPLYFLRVWGHVSQLRTHMLSHLVVSGNKDGSLNFWHLKEPVEYHSHYQDQIIRTPTVNTSCMSAPNHTLPITGLEIVSEHKSSLLVVSVDKEKYLITWSCMFIQDADLNQNFSCNHSAWAKLRVTARSSITLEEAFATPSMSVYCLNVWKTETMKFIVGTNAGFVGIGTLNEEIPVYQRCYIGSSVIMNIRSVHRNRLLGLIAGTCEDEYCRLFDDRRKRAILSLECGGMAKPVKVQWSQIRECLLYIGQEDRVEAWDLLSSDLAPVKVIPVDKMRDFATFVTGDKEYVVALLANEIIILPVPLNIKHLDDKEKLRFKRYISII